MKNYDYFSTVSQIILVQFVFNIRPDILLLFIFTWMDFNNSPGVRQHLDVGLLYVSQHLLFNRFLIYFPAIGKIPKNSISHIWPTVATNEKKCRNHNIFRDGWTEDLFFTIPIQGRTQTLKVVSPFRISCACHFYCERNKYKRWNYTHAEQRGYTWRKSIHDSNCRTFFFSLNIRKRKDFEITSRPDG